MSYGGVFEKEEEMVKWKMRPPFRMYPQKWFNNFILITVRQLATANSSTDNVSYARRTRRGLPLEEFTATYSGSSHPEL